MKVVLVLCILCVGVVMGMESCGDFKGPKVCGENNCIWFRKECVPCESVDRMITCRNKKACHIVDKQCFTKEEYVPTPEPTWAPSMAPTEYGIPCRDVKHKGKCMKVRYCKWLGRQGCCDLEDPNASCRARTKRSRCVRNGCNWDNDGKYCF